MDFSPSERGRASEARASARWLALLVGVGALLAAPRARAQELEPRAYANAPVGLHFAIADYSYVDGDVSTDASLPLQDGEVQTQGGTFAYVRSLGVLGRSAKLAIVVPYLRASGSATFQNEPRDRTTVGLGDPRVRFSVNFQGAPALSVDEFADYKQDLVVGGSVQVTLPVGDYDSDKLLNIGTHRWSIKPEIGLSKAWWQGRYTTELAVATSFYGDNDEFLGSTREQDPLFSFQVHVIRQFRHGVWASVDATYYSGGRTAVDGEEGDDRQGNTRVGATLSLPLSRTQSIKLHASTGVSIRTGGDFDLFGIGWQMRWGGGDETPARGPRPTSTDPGFLSHIPSARLGAALGGHGRASTPGRR